MIVAGIDVGGPRKGFHGVLLEGGEESGPSGSPAGQAPGPRDAERSVAAATLTQRGFVGPLRIGSLLHSTSPDEVVRWCRERGARAIGVDAPCRWRAHAGEPRLAERELRREGISCFFTPTEARAVELRRTAGSRSRPRRGGFYDWMLNGATLYERLERHYALFPAGAGRSGGPHCFETFPHAVAVALAGAPLSARRKRLDRRALLRAAGVDPSPLSNQDLPDAALCALAASLFLLDSYRAYGDVATGMILLPDSRPFPCGPRGGLESREDERDA